VSDSSIELGPKEEKEGVMMMGKTSWRSEMVSIDPCSQQAKIS
jgi:hypothetical protein